MILVLLPLAYYGANRKPARDHNLFDRMVLTVSAPVQWAMTSAFDAIDRVWHRYVALIDVEVDNAHLKEENAHLRAELASREESRLENQRLRQLVGLHESAPAVPMIFAQVIATSPSPLFRSLRVNAGSSQGITVGSAVVTDAGVVGRVAAVGPSYAEVMLLIDPNSSTDVLVQRTRVRARVQGAGDDDALGIDVHYLARTADIEPGDVLITSGVGNVFPTGLPVGRVIAVERTAFGLYQLASAQPAVDFARIESVMVIPSGWPKESTFEKADPPTIIEDAPLPHGVPIVIPAHSYPEPEPAPSMSSSPSDDRGSP